MALYHHFLDSKAARALANGKQTKVLNAICDLKKLCNHPKLIFDDHVTKAREQKHKAGAAADGFANCEGYFVGGEFDEQVSPPSGPRVGARR